MRAEELLAADDPGALLATLNRRPVSDRRWRLFAVACARQVWHLLPAEGRRLVEGVEKFADGQGDLQRLTEASYRVAVRWDKESVAATRASQAATAAARSATATEAAWAGAQTWRQAAAALAWQATIKVPPWELARPTWDRAQRAAHAAQCELMRDLFLPLFQPVTFAPAWREWHGGAAGKIAQEIYDRRRFEELPILADALEDAGCDERALLDHCRSGGPHVRGCWALDLVLNKG
jgi:hypothetical protein